MSKKPDRDRPSYAPRSSAEHLAWRLASVRQDMPPGWFLFDGAQVATIVNSLNSHGDRP